MAGDHPRYCLDTSAWLDGWCRYYPQDTFPSLWERVEGLILDGRIWWPEEVAHEIRDVDLRDWLAPHTITIIETASIWTDAQSIQQRFNPDLDGKGISGADSFVIAAAQVRSLKVVTGEKPSNGRPKIPNVCDVLGIQYSDLLQMVRAEGWKF